MNKNLLAKELLDLREEINLHWDKKYIALNHLDAIIANLLDVEYPPTSRDEFANMQESND